MKEVSLSDLVTEANISSIGILVASDTGDEQVSDEKGLVNVVSLIRKNHPMVQISVYPYLAKSSDYVTLNEGVQNFSKNFKLTLTVLGENEIRIFDFLPATQFNSLQIKLP